MSPIIESKSSLSVYNSLRKRELGQKMPIRAIKQQYLAKNLAIQHFSQQKIEGHAESIQDLAISTSANCFVTTGKEGNIKIWDLNTYKNRWIFHPFTKIKWLGKIKVEQEIAVCYGLTVDNGYIFQQICKIYIINLKQKQIIGQIEVPFLEIEHKTLCLINRQIFAYLKEGTIGQWNLHGHFIGSTPSEKIRGLNSFKCCHSTEFLVLGVKQFILIHTFNALATGNQQKLTEEVKKLDLKNKQIIALKIKDNLVICSYVTQHEEQPNLDENPLRCLTIDLKNEHKRKFIAQPINMERLGIVNKIKTNQHSFIYLATLSKEIRAFNYHEKYYLPLMRQNKDIIHLKLKGSILISSYYDRVKYKMGINFWHALTGQKIGEQIVENVLSCSKLKFSRGKLLIVIEKVIYIYDYLNSLSDPQAVKLEVSSMENKAHRESIEHS